MFRGVNTIVLDSKFRMTIPRRYHPLLAEEAENLLVVTIDPEYPCLLLYPLTLWQTLEANLQTLPSLNKAARRLQRLLIGHATELEIKQGRILLPQALREYGRLEKQTVLVGQGNKFEIWAESMWASMCQEWLMAHQAETPLAPELQKLSL